MILLAFLYDMHRSDVLRESLLVQTLLYIAFRSSASRFWTFHTLL